MKLPPVMPEKVRLEKPWTFSQRGVEFLKREEGCVLRIYRDVVGVRTIGIGHRIVDEDERKRFERGITEQEAEDILRRDLAWVERSIAAKVAVPLAQGEYDALVSLVFNCGPLPLHQTLGRILNMGEYDKARERFTDWIKGGSPPVALPVLVARRAREQVLWDAVD
jgi:lysozyme